MESNKKYDSASLVRSPHTYCQQQRYIESLSLFSHVIQFYLLLRRLLLLQTLCELVTITFNLESHEPYYCCHYFSCLIHNLIKAMWLSDWAAVGQMAESQMAVRLYGLKKYDKKSIWPKYV